MKVAMRLYRNPNGVEEKIGQLSEVQNKIMFYQVIKQITTLIA